MSPRSATVPPPAGAPVPTANPTSSNHSSASPPTTESGRVLQTAPPAPRPTPVTSALVRLRRSADATPPAPQYSLPQASAPASSGPGGVRAQSPLARLPPDTVGLRLQARAGSPRQLHNAPHTAPAQSTPGRL